jgi:bifunctional pyridoxal-dependent enzyme with beta-cystathionase and maltose regulon repressor activities
VPALYHAVKTFTAPGEGVIIMTPVYYPFFTAVKNAGRTLAENPLVNVGDTGRYEIDFDALETLAAVPATKMLIFCSPHNPVGRVWTRAELEKVADICLRHHLLLVSDEIHFDFLLGGHEHTVIARVSPEIADQCIIATSPSKTFNLAGLQTANLIIPNPALRHTYEESFETGFSDWNLPVLGAKACELAYTKGAPWLEALLAKIAENAQVVADTLRPTPVKVTPLEGSYLLWLDCRSLGLSPKELEKRMVAHDVFADEGYIFGTSGIGFERLNLACPTRYIRSAAERMLSFVGRK